MALDTAAFTALPIMLAITPPTPSALVLVALSIRHATPCRRLSLSCMTTVSRSTASVIVPSVLVMRTSAPSSAVESVVPVRIGMPDEPCMLTPDAPGVPSLAPESAPRPPHARHPPATAAAATARAHGAALVITVGSPWRSVGKSRWPRT